MEQCLDQCWMFTLYEGIMPQSVLNVYIVWWNCASVSAECLHCTVRWNSASISAECYNVRWNSAECLHCMMEQCLSQCWMFTLYDGTVPRSVLNAYIVLYDGTVPQSVLNAYIVQWNSALVSAEWKESVSHGRKEYFYMLARWLLIHNTNNCEQKEIKLL